MINVAMRNQDTYHMELLFRQIIPDVLPLCIGHHARIDDECLAGFRMTEHIGVLLKGVADKDLYIHLAW